LEKPVQVKQSIAASFEDLGLVIETFNKTAVMAIDEVIGDLIKMVIEAVQATNCILDYHPETAHFSIFFFLLLSWGGI